MPNNNFEKTVEVDVEQTSDRVWNSTNDEGHSEQLRRVYNVWTGI